MPALTAAQSMREPLRLAAFLAGRAQGARRGLHGQNSTANTWVMARAKRATTNSCEIKNAPMVMANPRINDSTAFRIITSLL
jgi:hypothetical protein